MIIADIYDSITGYLLQVINIHQRRVNIKHSMLVPPIFNKLSTCTYQQEIFPTFMLSYGAYIIRPLK